MERVFIALWLPEETKEALSGIIKRYKRHNDALKWVKPENIHITIKFIGEVNRSGRENIEVAMDRFFAEHTVNAFDISIEGVGVFPSWARPRVVWLGMQPDKEVKKIKELWNGIEAKLTDAGIKESDKPFSPHITIARIKKRMSISQIKKLKKFLTINEPEAVKCTLSVLSIVKSRLTPEGPIYSLLKSYELRRD